MGGAGTLTIFGSKIGSAAWGGIFPHKRSVVFKQDLWQNDGDSVQTILSGGIEWLRCRPWACRVVIVVMGSLEFLRFLPL